MRMSCYGQCFKSKFRILIKIFPYNFSLNCLESVNLQHYIHSVKIGCEAPSKFNQSGTMLGKIIPRCIDTYATVRQTAVDILRRILEISCIYETLTLAENEDWYRELGAMREDIGTDDVKQLYEIVEEISKIIAERLSNFQYVQFW